METCAFYAGTLGDIGHYFWLTPRKSVLYRGEIMSAIPDFIQSWADMWDSGLLKNGKRPDVYDGKVFAIPAKGPWIAFVWWDNSIDKRGGSNSAFYVSGFEWEDRDAALTFAMEKWPEVVKRQRQPLVLQP
jgi:hypothetical protein